MGKGEGGEEKGEEGEEDGEERGGGFHRSLLVEGAGGGLWSVVVVVPVGSLEAMGTASGFV